ncbi:zinc-binding alcohol dehydrogenase family protein [Paenibacillus hamazuiensis]|uniref:zinc-binding alcohol dehydrogenase family protein n=1 Tax=Paenibacillus hamazuiensis TaxID=2936508 RepID=UPI00200BC89E|nr:zinc-binding alcohol dehydrogenase family protein [Paenibacillus hamazuiensis]
MNRSQTMKAVGYYRTLPISDPEYLVDLIVDKPVPTGKDILVKINAISVNPADVKTRAGGYNDPNTPKIIGWDAAGVVEQVGPDCTMFKPGDEVYYAGDVDRPGSNSEYQLVDERIVGRKPASLSYAQAASMPLTTLTAWEALHHRLGISRNEQENQGQSILIIGAAGGVGSVATQLAKLAGLTVIGTASREESSRWAREHGADHIINHREAFGPQLASLGFDAVDYIVCLNDTVLHWDNMAEAIRPQGKICSIVPAGKPVNMDAIFFKSVSFHWELMFTRPKFQTGDMTEQHRVLNAAADLIDAGRLKETMTRRLEPINAANLKLAHEKLLAGDMIGKLVLEGF